VTVAAAIPRAQTRPAAVPSAGDPQRAANDSQKFRLNGAVPNRTGMRFDPLLSFEDWQMLGPRLAKHATASLWWLGDWLVFGQYKYGRRYKLGVVLTGLDYQTLRNYAVVARRFELSRRRDTLSFQHHAEVCALSDEEQDRWLGDAETGRWSRNELRRRLRSSSDCGTAMAQALLRLKVETDRHDRWCAAASRTACELQEWMVRTLDEAAEQLLTA
jgi:hypothetical protein